MSGEETPGTSGSGASASSQRKLRRVEAGHNWVGGVCAGIAYWLGAPAWLVRFAFVVAFFGYGVGLGIYILLWIFMPKWNAVPADYDGVTGD